MADKQVTKSTQTTEKIRASESKECPKVVYLFGAGATHAELFDGYEHNKRITREKYGLLMSDLSKRVLKKVEKNEVITKALPFIKSSKEKGNIELFGNIELLISLIESNNIQKSETVSNKIRHIVRKDVENKIEYFFNKKGNEFYLYRALLEMHKKIRKKEELIGLITLNYDTILDEAYTDLYKKKRNYCLSSEGTKSIPLLKLHGSFNWEDGIEIDGNEVKIPIIPLGTKKNYLERYYSFVWGKTIEVLSKCDTLRIVGCSMNESDFGLIDLLFKANLCHKENPIEIQIINLNGVGKGIVERYGFLSNIKPIYKINRGQFTGVKEFDGQDKDANIFKLWLRVVIARHLSRKRIQRSKYIRKIFDL